MEAVNPLRTLREAIGQSVSEMAELSGVTPQAIIWNEQGVYTSPSPRYLSCLLAYSDYRVEPGGHNDRQASVSNRQAHEAVPDSLSRDYRNFQKLRREASYGALDDEPDFPVLMLNSNGNLEHPFVCWRKDSGIISRVAISKLFCVHPSLIFKFEKQPHKCNTVPGELRAALIDSGYRHGTVDELESAYAEFRSWLRTKTNV